MLTFEIALSGMIVMSADGSSPVNMTTPLKLVSEFVNYRLMSRTGLYYKYIFCFKVFTHFQKLDQISKCWRIAMPPSLVTKLGSGLC